MKAIATIREGYLRSHLSSAAMKPRRGYADFTTIESISPVAALMVAAEFDRARQITGKRLNAVNLSRWHSEVREVLDGLDFLSLLDISSRPISIKEIRDKVYIVPIVSGTITSGIKAGQLTSLVQKMASVLVDKGDEVYRRLQSVVIEGMENASLHAYNEKYSNPVPHVSLWWLTGTIDLPSRRLTVAILDQGATIPVTLPYWTRFQRFKAWYSEVVGREYDPVDPSGDHRALEAAMVLGSSATGLPQHGKGLPEFKAFIDSCKAAKVRIASRHGEYTYRKGEDAIVTWREVPLQGTLVEWDVFL